MKRNINPARLRKQRIRVAGVLVWSAFLAAALATMICFAFIDPQAFADGDTPAALAWFIAHAPRAGRR
jgi:hypothetical protein